MFPEKIPARAAGLIGGARWASQRCQVAICPKGRSHRARIRLFLSRRSVSL